MIQTFTTNPMLRMIPPTVERYAHQGWGFARAGHLHAGIDFPSKKGNPVFAAADGVVSQVVNSEGSTAGRYVSINHGNGITSRYMHNTTNLVIKGQKVRQGQKIATVGTTGTVSSGPHVHFDVKLSDAAVAEYIRRFGSPDPRAGYGQVSTGRGVPSETFVENVKFTPAVIENGIKRGVVFIQAAPFGGFLLAAGLAVAAGLLISRLR